MKITKRQMRQILESSYDYDQDYVMHPTDYVRGAMSLLSPEEFNGIGIEKMMREGEVAAMELRSNWPEDEGFGSSDRTYELQGFLEMLGFKTGFPNGTLEVVKEGKMKITKRQLRRIIKEEKAKILSEQPISGEQADQMQTSQEFTRILGSINDLVSQALQLGVDPYELEEELKSIAVSVTDLDHLQGY